LRRPGLGVGEDHDPCQTGSADRPAAPSYGQARRLVHDNPIAETVAGLPQLETKRYFSSCFDFVGVDICDCAAITIVMEDNHRESAAKAIIEAYRRLSEARERLSVERAGLTRELRLNERSMSDCRAAARFFGIDDRLPATDDRAETALHEQALRNARIHSAVQEAAVAPIRTVWRSFNSHAVSTDEMPALPMHLDQATHQTQADESPAPSPVRPPLREYLLLELQRAGAAGAKAAALRASFQEHFHIEIHEKTVGMTLYRLSQNREVHRRGHFWFYGADPEGHDQTIPEEPV